jgi:Domain of unknown function (DUF1990)
MDPTQHERLERNLAAQGSGPLLQRDYWAAIRDCRISPRQFGGLFAAHFDDFAPNALARFERMGASADRPLRVGDELRVHIRMAGTFGVRVLHLDENSITFCTLQGHPEAGRITFGAYRNRRGDVVFHIRSRARSASSKYYAGFVAVGEPMQTMTWTDYVDQLAHSIGRGVLGRIHEETRVLDSKDDENVPTYLARGD